MRFWLDIGVDGFRLDAIPYLCEREGTINENLPETHEVLKELRRLLDQSYEARMFLPRRTSGQRTYGHISVTRTNAI